MTPQLCVCDNDSRAVFDCVRQVQFPTSWSLGSSVTDPEPAKNSVSHLQWACASISQVIFSIIQLLLKRRYNHQNNPQKDLKNSCVYAEQGLCSRKRLARLYLLPFPFPDAGRESLIGRLRFIIVTCSLARTMRFSNLFHWNRPSLNNTCRSRSRRAGSGSVNSRLATYGYATWKHSNRNTCIVRVYCHRRSGFPEM